MAVKAQPPKKKSNTIMRLTLFWAIVVFGALLIYALTSPTDSLKEVALSDVIKRANAGEITKIELTGNDLKVTPEGNEEPTERSTKDASSSLQEQGLNADADVELVVTPPSATGDILWNLAIIIIPVLLIIAFFVFMMRQAQGQNNQALGFGKSKAILYGDDKKKVLFDDIAGNDSAKQDLEEVVDFLKHPKKYESLGAKIPKGVLLVGSPGTGKTMLARAVAGEASVPFFSISGSEFVEMFVGVGASRVRDLFAKAKKNAPAIIFIDEIDAVGRRRGSGMGGGHDEREQTLNQLLVEMDGFEGNEGVIVIAATNRPDVLDPALLRPGRFDRQVVVPLPDIRGREQILKVHLTKVPVEDSVSILPIARGTPGFSGADLANLVNEAALFAARTNKRKVSMLELDKAKDKIMMGAERRSMVMDDNEKKLTAYHEAGHAIVGLLVPEHDPVYKVSIIPRGRALGVTMFLPERDRYSHTRRRLESQLASLFGGRVAEELIFGADSVTTGASNDIMRATDIARKMVTSWGLSTLGPLTFGQEEEEVFLGRSVNQNKEISNETARQIDDEVRAIIDRNYQRAKTILTDNLACLHLMAEGLIKYETIDSSQIKEIMDGKAPSPPDDWESIKLADSDNDDKDNDKQEKSKKSKGSASASLGGEPLL